MRFFWRSAFTSSRCATNPGCRHASRAGACCAATPGGWRAVLLALFAVFASGAVAAIVVGVLILAAILEGGLPFGVSFALTLVMFAFTIVVDCVFAPLGYAALSATFYEFSQERGIDIPYRIDEPSRTCRARLARAAVGSFLAMLGLVSLLSYDPLHGVFESESQREPAPDFAITAHRGGGARGSENTLAAFQKRYRPRRGLGGAWTVRRRRRRASW